MPQKPRTFYLINEINLTVRTRLERLLRPYDLTVAQFTVMSQLAGRDKISSAKIARARRVSPQTINELITGLEERGMVVRVGDPANRRELLVSLTEAGRERIAEGDALIDALEAELFADLDKKAQAQLRAILETMIGTIRRIDAS